MATLNLPPMFAALYVFLAVAGALIVAHLVAIAAARLVVARAHRRSGASSTLRGNDRPDAAARDAVDHDGAFVITGVPTRSASLIALPVNSSPPWGFSLVFGALLGTASAGADLHHHRLRCAMIRVGVDPWVVHFFAFFLAVWGELTPPTSVAAAITAKIAETSFMQTLFRAITICVSLFVLMAGVFTRPELVLEPGIAQIGAMLLLMTATIGITFSIQARFSDRAAIDVPLRLLLAAFALVVLLHPDQQLAVVACVPVGLFVAYWILRRRHK